MSSVQVAVRARPFSKRELDAGSQFCIEMRRQSTIIFKSGLSSGKGISGKSNAKEFVYDFSYWSVDPRDEGFTSQEKVFSDLGTPVLNSAFEGYNACVFAYGQTGSGKTYTMMGTEMATGLTPRICEGLYSRMTLNSDQVSYKTEVSYMEVYNEKVRDLLCPGTGKSQHSLRVREHPKDGPYVEDLSKHTVYDYNGIFRLIELGNSRRVTASTKMNDMSSRSHAIFTIVFTQAKYEYDLPCETVSKIHLVDLAGSERASATGAEGDRLREGGNINRSLVCLGTVISALADMSAHSGRQKKPYIPYRDSVLTWLLKDSLGGNSKSIMIATISPAECSYGETLSTLRYASRAKNIVNKPTVNEDQNVKLIRDLRSEIQRLKSIIATGQLEPNQKDLVNLERSKSISLAEDIYKKEEQVAELTKEWAGKWKDIQKILQERHVALHSEGVKMVVDSEQPHFVGVDPDILSTGLVFYYLKDGCTTIGAWSGHQQPDIVVAGTDVQPEHCKVEYKRNKAVLHPLKGDCRVNHSRLRRPTKLSQGDLVQLGSSTVFRFNHPQEADKMRRRQSEGLLLPRRYMIPTSRDADKSTMSPVEVQTAQLFSGGAVRAQSSRTAAETQLTHVFSPKESEGNLEVGTKYLPLLPVPAADDDEKALEESVQNRSSWKSCLCYILLWMLSPLVLSMFGVLAIPAFFLLAVLLFTMKVFGLSQRFRLTRWIATLMTITTSVLVSPFAGICDAFFRLAFSFLTSVKIIEPVPVQPIETQN